MGTIDFLDAIRRVHNLPSDYAAAQLIGITRSQVSRYRHGKDFIGDDIAIRVAELLQLDPGYVMACAHAERAASEQARGVWTRIAERLKDTSATAVTVILSVLFLGGWHDDSRAAARTYVDAPAQPQQLTAYTLARVLMAGSITCVRWISRALEPFTLRPALA